VNIEEFDHARFMEDVIKKYNLAVVLPPPSDPRYVKTIGEAFNANSHGHSLLATSMAAQLVDHCRNSSDYEPLLGLSVELLSLLEAGVREGVVLVTVQEVRSALFWAYVRAGHADLRLLDAESRLLSTMCGGDYELTRRAEASLSQGWRHETGGQSSNMERP
jgi:hypothetical protein